jgi:hypothetical protein
VPQGGGSDVTVYTAPATAPTVNLEQLDQIAIPACRPAPIRRPCSLSAPMPATYC